MDDPMNSFDALSSERVDPKQRVELLAERIALQRALHPDLAAVLRLDASTENELLALLSDSQLSRELRPMDYLLGSRISPNGNGKPYNPMRDEAARYTHRMDEITRIIGSARLDDFVDYERKLGIRQQVAAFDAGLPAADKLTPEQRTALIDLFHDQSFSTSLGSRRFGPLPPLGSNLTSEERSRRLQILKIIGNERYAKLIEASIRISLERATAILTPEQTQALTDSKLRELEQHRVRIQALRKELGIAADEVLDSPEEDVPPSPPIAKNLRLTIDLTINATRVVKQLSSVRGGSVSFDGPEGLDVEVRPYRDQAQVKAELELYEKVPSGRRMLCQLVDSVQFGAFKRWFAARGSSNLVRGRKCYVIHYRVTGTYR